MPDGADELGAFDAGGTHGVAARPTSRLHLGSDGLGWRALHAASHAQEPYESMKLAPVPNPAFCYVVRGAAAVRGTLGDGRRLSSAVEPSRFVFVPDRAATEWDLDAPLDILHIYLRRAVLDRYVAEEHGADPGRLEILPRVGAVDPLLEQLALAVMGALRLGEGTALYVDGLAQAMAAHLVQAHSTLSRPVPERPVDGLVPRRLRRLLDHIEAELAGDLSLDALAHEVGLSPFYLARHFRVVLGEPPHRYVLRRRVERAKRLLLMGAAIAEVAAACGFSDQSSLTRAFRQATGTTPGTFRRGR